MDISVTRFKQQCLEIIRRVERTGQPVSITRRRRVVARLVAPRASDAERGAWPWERLRGSAVCLIDPATSVPKERDFEALRRSRAVNLWRP